MDDDELAVLKAGEATFFDLKTGNKIKKDLQNIEWDIDAAEKGVARKVTKDEINNMKMGFNRDYTRGFYNKVGSIVGIDLPMNRGVRLGDVKNGNVVLEHVLKHYERFIILQTKTRV